jgi:hypothetical protein
MNNKQKRIRLTIIISTVILWLTVNMYYFWVKVAGGVFLVTGLIELTCFLTLLIATAILSIRIIKHSDWRNLKNFLTIGLIILVLTVLNIRQLRANENTFQSPVKMRACYEGTMNTSHLYFRENGTFEDFNIGWFAFVHYTKGTWEQQRDTLLLDFKGESPGLIDKKMIIKDDYLFKIQADTLTPTYYYMGYCKGLN